MLCEENKDGLARCIKFCFSGRKEKIKLFTILENLFSHQLRLMRNGAMRELLKKDS